MLMRPKSLALGFMGAVKVSAVLSETSPEISPLQKTWESKGADAVVLFGSTFLYDFAR
jgi:hypothetical protein